MSTLWSSPSADRWRLALDRYEEVIAAQGVSRLPELDRWYRAALPAAVGARQPAWLTLDELVRLTEWKMARGVWRAPNLVLVRGNDPDLVRETSESALREIPHPTRPVSLLASLAGVGPATASAALASVAPSIYPFFDELVAAQVPGLGKVAWTLGYYRRYAAALAERAGALGEGWTATMLERALWADVGGKAGARA
jgi:hypothetical protein